MGVLRQFPRASVRIVIATAAAAVLALGASVVAQIPGRNVNMVSGESLPNGDPFLQRQNEGSMAASTRNPLHLVAGSNDYRTIDVPMPADGGQETGDAWLGLYKSLDGGQRWISTLLPGYPQEPVGPGRSSPLYGYGAAADPVVRAGTHGLFYYGGLVFDRAANGKSAIFMARFIDNNNREDRDAIAYLGTSLIAMAPAAPAGSDGVFLDKPWVAVDVPRGATPATCRIETPGRAADGTVTQVVQTIPAGTVYVAYAAFSGPAADRRSDLMLARSFDCGQTWLAPLRISNLDDRHNQGVSLAIDPRNGDVYAAWRRFSERATDSPNIDAIMAAKLPFNGRQFNPPGVARRFPKGNKHGLNPERLADKIDVVKVDDVAEFDQAADEFKFRTNAYPVMTVDGDGRLYLAWSERGFATVNDSAVSGDARIVMVSTIDAATFTTPIPVDNAPDPSGPVQSGLLGHQVMPSLTFAGGKLLVAFYDVRETISLEFGKQITDNPCANLPVPPCNPVGQPRKWNTIDLRAALGTPGMVPQFAPSVKVSQYPMGYRDASSSVLEQMAFNPPNLPMFRQGTAAFLGDYIDLAPAPAFVSVADKERKKDRKTRDVWAFNTDAVATPPMFHAVWTDNRDVRFPQDDANGDGNPWNDYGPPENPALTSQVCVPGNAGSRNQNLYTSRITGGLLAGSPANAKPLSADMQRAFVVFAQNTTLQLRHFRMTIMDQPVGGRATFNQFPLPPFTLTSPPPLVTLDVSVLPRSTAARTLYVTSTDPRAQVIVDISEITGVGGTEVVDGLAGAAVINPDRQNPELENPELENPELENVDIANQEVHNPELENPELENPELENPELENPELENPELENIVIGNPELENPELENPELENPELENPELENGPLSDGGYGGPTSPLPGIVTDITWTVTNAGNTTTAFNVHLFLAQAGLPSALIKAQLLLYETYQTPAVRPGTCELTYESRNILVANIPSPTFVLSGDGSVPDQNHPSEKNAVITLGPGKSGKIALRVFDKDKSNNVIVDGASIDAALNPFVALTLGVASQPVGTVEALAGELKAPIVTVTGSNLVFVGQPSNIVAGQPITPPIVVKVFDNSGAVLPGVLVTLALAPNDAGAVLTGGLTATSNVSGMASFPNVIVSEDGLGLRIIATATSPGFTASGASAPFNVAPAVSPTAVTTTADSGPGSLRAAMEYTNANDTGLTQLITFNIPGAGPHTIVLASPLPPITASVIIEGPSQPGWSAAIGPRIEVNGNGLAAGNGFTVGANDVSIRALSITGFPEAGVFALSVSNLYLEMNHIGVDPSGTVDKGNGQSGVRLRRSSAAGIRQNLISGNGQHGVLIEAGTNNVIEANRIGTDTTGNVAIANNWSGVAGYAQPFGEFNVPLTGTIIQINRIAGNGEWGIDLQYNAVAGGVQTTSIGANVIGLSAGWAALPNGVIDGAALGGGIRAVRSDATVIGWPDGGLNYIAGNNGPGIYIQQGSVVAPVIRANAIGLSGADVAVPNTYGIVATGRVIVGGVEAGEGNRISGNATSGVLLDQNAGASIVAGNVIGLNSAGATAGNGENGITLFANTGAIIGGSSPAARNVISGNAYAGIRIYRETGFPLPSDIEVKGNYIGTDATGTLARGNGQFGIEVMGTSIALGGLGANDGNLIAFNGFTFLDTAARGGIHVNGDASTTGVTIVGNSIHSNSRLGIDLGAIAVTPNDGGDADTGPNGLQNFPSLANAENGTESAEVDYALTSTGLTPFTLYFYASPSCSDTSRQGAMLIGSQSASTNADGVLNGTKVFGQFVTAGYFITATAVNETNGDTSEFSACAEVADSVVEVGPAGGTGGTAFAATHCAPGSRVTGLVGRAGDNVDRTELLCAPPPALAPVSQIYVAGGFGGTDYGNALTCPTNSVAVGLHGRHGVVAGNFAIDTLGVSCRDIATGGLSQTPTVGADAGTTPFTLTCPAPTQMVGVRGRQGAFLDQIYIRCQ